MSGGEAESVRVLAQEVSGDAAKAETWLSRPNRALSGAVPTDLLATEEGRRAVRDVLGRLAHGVFS